jgi:hypothetical protein
MPQHVGDLDVYLVQSLCSIVSRCQGNVGDVSSRFLHKSALDAMIKLEKIMLGENTQPDNKIGK